MSCKFIGIKKLPADSYRVNFLVNGQPKQLFFQGIENLMEDVLDDEDEWQQWCYDASLPEIFGHMENDYGQNDVNFAEHYYKANEDSYALDFQD